jgi:hypothetical protein
MLFTSSAASSRPIYWENCSGGFAGPKAVHLVDAKEPEQSAEETTILVTVTETKARLGELLREAAEKVVVVPLGTTSRSGWH